MLPDQSRLGRARSCEMYRFCGIFPGIRNPQLFIGYRDAMPTNTGHPTSSDAEGQQNSTVFYILPGFFVSG